MGLRWRLLPSACGSLDIEVHRFPAGRSRCRRSALGTAKPLGEDFDSFVGFRIVGHEQFHSIDRVGAGLAGAASDPLADLISRGQLAPGRGLPDPRSEPAGHEPEQPDRLRRRI